MIRQLRVHGWRLFVCGVNTAEIKVRDEQGDWMFQIRQLLWISERQAREPAIEQADAQIRALNVAGAD